MLTLLAVLALATPPPVAPVPLPGNPIDWAGLALFVGACSAMLATIGGGVAWVYMRARPPAPEKVDEEWGPAGITDLRGRFDRLEVRVQRLTADAIRHMPWDLRVWQKLKDLDEDPGPPPPLLPGSEYPSDVPEPRTHHTP